MGRVRSRQRIVIVGAGRAGVSAAEELRRRGFWGQIVVLSEEVEPPYYRPSCSKGLLTGSQRPSDLELSLNDCVDVRWRLGRRVAHLDPAARVIETDSNETYRYDGLIIASGSRTVAPAGWPVGEPGLHLLYRLSDAWALRRDLQQAGRVAIVGGGLTGCEAAYAVRSVARDCVIIDSSHRVMKRALGTVASKFVTDEVRRERVELRLGRRVKSVTRGRRGPWWLELDDGSEVDADLVVVTTGERPNTAWLEGAPGLDVSDGILCDETLRVVGGEGIVAAGAVARWPNLRFDAKPRRCGQWLNAMEQGKAAARTLLAGRKEVPPVMPLPRLWSDQFGLHIQASGDIGGDGTEVHMTQLRPGSRNVARTGLLVSYVKDDRLVGLVGVNASHVFTAMTQSLVATGRPVPVTRSGHPDLSSVDHPGHRRPDTRPADRPSGRRRDGSKIEARAAAVEIPASRGRHRQPEPELESDNWPALNYASV